MEGEEVGSTHEVAVGAVGSTGPVAVAAVGSTGRAAAAVRGLIAGAIDLAIADCQLPVANFKRLPEEKSAIGNRQSAIEKECA
jgi:hypothetical protein